MKPLPIRYVVLSCWLTAITTATAAVPTLLRAAPCTAAAARSSSSGGSSSIGGDGGIRRRSMFASVTAAFSTSCFTSAQSKSTISTIQQQLSIGGMKGRDRPVMLPWHPCSSSSSRSTVREGLQMSASSSSNNDDNNQPLLLPQVFATGYSSNPSLSLAIREAIAMASANLPIPAASTTTTSSSSGNNMIDLAIVFVSSLYDDINSVLVPQLLQSVLDDTPYIGGVQHVLGCTAGGVIGSTTTTTTITTSTSSSTNTNTMRPIEAESTPAISITLALLPDVQINTFHIDGRDVPDLKDDYYPASAADAASSWNKAVGLVDGTSTAAAAVEENGDDDDNNNAPIFMILPSPAFQTNLDDFLRGMRYAYPRGQVVGGIASTVSSLSRARIFSYSSSSSSSQSSTASSSSSLTGRDCTRGDGCVGIRMRGDIQADTILAQGAKPVGGVYRVVATGGDGRKRTSTSSSEDGGDNGVSSAYDEACRSTIGAIVLDEDATVEDAFETGDDDNDNDDDVEGNVVSTDVKRARLLADYAKARIPKPPLAEANFVMKNLSDDDRAYMRRALLIGLERSSGIVGRTPNELLRLARGEGHRFTVRQVASAGMKDGSVTFPLGSVNVNVGDRCRFFVRDGEFAKREVSFFFAVNIKLALYFVLSF
jgi:small ligand-binding sensory domain FIST